MEQENIIKKFFPGLVIYKKEDFSVMSPQQLTEVFQDIEKSKRSIDEKVIQLGTQIENKQKILADTKAQIKDKFGVDTEEELQVLRLKAMEDFDITHKQLEEFIK